jgi:Protein of unknown function (DUF3761)
MRRFRVGALLAAVVCSAGVASTASAAAPPGATAQCRDGTYSYSQHRSGTCSHHGGVAVSLDGSGSSIPSSGARSSSGACGTERWTVKTLQHRPQLLPTRSVTLRYLVTRPAPSYLPSSRLPFERHIFAVIAAVVLIRQEAVSDFHLVLSASGRTMIAESPAANCDPGAAPFYRREMTDARARVRVCARARITGVAFFDFKHGQTDVAPNAIELHPILAFRCLSA